MMKIARTMKKCIGSSKTVRKGLFKKKIGKGPRKGQETTAEDLQSSSKKLEKNNGNTAGKERRNVLSGFLRTADLGQQYEVVSRVAGNFSYLSTQIFFSVSHSAWYALSLPKSRSTLVYSTPWDSLVCGPAPQIYSGSLLRGLLPELYYRLKAMVFGGPSILRQDSLPPGHSLRTFRKICDRLYRRRFSGVGSTAQGFSLTKLDTTTSSISSTALTGWSDFIVLYIRSGLVLLSCLFQSHQHRVPKYIFPYFFSICFKEFVGRRVFSISAPSASCWSDE
jgi:hypothetical protein